MTSETVTETGSEQSVPAPVDLPPVGEELNLDASENYFNRELSQLQFNYRVLKQALDTRRIQSNCSLPGNDAEEHPYLQTLDLRGC